MSAASLPRFLPSPYAVRTAVFVVPLVAALLALLVFGVTGVAASTPAPSFDVQLPFRWT
jgi:hypothetical protein